EVALAEAAGRGALMGPVMVAQQRGGGGVDLEDDIATAAPVAAVGTGQRLELLATDRGGSVAAGSRGDVEPDAVDERGHGGLRCSVGRRGIPPGDASRGGAVGSAPRRRCGPRSRRGADQALSTTLTTRRSRLRPNSTVPAVRANRVSSLPRPT